MIHVALISVVVGAQPMYATMKCHFTSFKVNTFRCVDKSEHPTYQIPRVCSPSNPYLPSVFTIWKTTDGTNWKLELDPQMAFKLNNHRKQLWHKFGIEQFDCESLDSYKLSVGVLPMQPRVPHDAYFDAVCVVLLLGLLFVCCITDCLLRDHNDPSPSSPFFMGVLTGAFVSGDHRRDTPHFE